MGVVGEVMAVREAMAERGAVWVVGAGGVTAG